MEKVNEKIAIDVILIDFQRVFDDVAQKRPVNQTEVLGVRRSRQLGQETDLEAESRESC